MNKTSIRMAVATLGVIGATWILLPSRPKPAGNQPATTGQEADDRQPALRSAGTSTQKTNPFGAQRRPANESQSAGARIGPHTNLPRAKGPTSLSIHASFEQLIDSQTSHQQKQEIWRQVAEAGKLDEAIDELEQRVKDNPTEPTIPASLGQAYLFKAGHIQDIREQGILGMKADQAFDAALALDASNWEARFWKATAMSYWPPQLNKQREVMQHLSTLIEQQESTTPRPEFAQTYALLGTQYQKNGYADQAREILQRGSKLFPNDPTLKGKPTTPSVAD